MYDFMKEYVIMITFMLYATLGIIGIGHWIVTFAKWVKKMWRKDKGRS